MAIVGQQLKTAEPGWRSYDENDIKIIYTGTWSTASDGGSSYNYYYGAGGKINFKFYGQKLRIIGIYNTNRSNSINIIIDGILYNYSNYFPLQYQTLVFEKTDLDPKLHTVEIYNNITNGYIELDRIDIDDTGYIATPVGRQLLAPEPGWQRIDDTNSKIIYIGNWYKYGPVNANSDSVKCYNYTYASSSPYGSRYNQNGLEKNKIKILW